MGTAIGGVLAIVAGVSGDYLLAFIGAGSACRLLVYCLRGPSTNLGSLPNESQIARWWRERQEKQHPQ